MSTGRRRARLAVVLALVTGLAVTTPAAPAHADTLDDILEILEQFLESIGLPDSFVDAFIGELIGYFGTAENSYLPYGADFSVMYPDMAQAVTIGDAKAVLEKRNKDRQDRGTEVMDVAASVTRQIPFQNMQLATLRGANASPVSIIAALQIGNEINAMTVGGMMDLLGMLAEQIQMDVDRAVQEEYTGKQAYQWARYHFRRSGHWQGERRWQPDVLGY